MIEKLTRRTPARKAVPPIVNLCECFGCRQHIARLEELNAQLSRENDRLQRELREGKRAA